MFSWFRRCKQRRDWDKASTGLRAAREARRSDLLGQEAAVDWLEALLLEADPIGINFESNSDEYRPEAETITLRRFEASSLEDVHRIVYEEFVRWFGEAGPPDRYSQIAADLWQSWNAVDPTIQ